MFRLISGGRIPALLAAIFIVLACGGVSSAKADEELTFSHAGYERRCLVHVPAGKPAGRLPLVLFLHGAGGSAAGAARRYGWEEAADRVGFLVAFPEAMPARPGLESSFRMNPRFWRDGRSGQPGAAEKIDDIGFVRELLDRLEARFSVDPRRVYATGMSSGGGMTFTLGVALSDRLAAIAPVASHLFVTDPKISQPVSLIYFIGDSDPLNPLAGGDAPTPWGRRTQKPPVQNSIDTWARLLGCPAAPTEVKAPAGVRALRYGPGRDGASEVLYYVIAGMGHSWPGGEERLPESMVGAPSKVIDATTMIWAFFARHPR